ncbi:circadian clock protein KaiC [Natranaerofaba carboxydovora]|uniref:circadian clock protein KaiC n=1 Tax=Natranaerofaba carboxydovora TaxID=2742683 RepID=UPI001F13B0D7|nr:circadian clock protein KaiC [Natranaerofaba carboxydovora]UMZ74474.1 Circadian clock protein kinase KaiC [Natranaerofaba carboxydovora]
MKNSNKNSLPKVETGVPGFDLICLGGIPRGRTTLVSGTAGSAKTVFGAQFLVGGIEIGEAGVFVTFEETPEDIKANLKSFNWDVEKWEEDNKWVFVDGSPSPEEELNFTGEFDLEALLARIKHAVKKVDAKRVTLDSLGSIFYHFEDASLVRHEIYKIAYTLKKMGVTAVLTAERSAEYGDISRFGIEEFVTDNVIVLRNAMDKEKRRRTVEILKFRGTMHQKGEFPFTIDPSSGIVAIPLSAMKMEQRSTNIRITSGNKGLDKMCDGGFFRDCVALISGATGTGKTLITTEFISGGTETGDKCMLFAFEESRDQLLRNASGWGVDFESMEKEGKLKIICEYPETSTLEEHLTLIQDYIKEFQPTRVAVDSLSALERVSTTKGFREFVVSLSSFLKEMQITGLFTSTTPSLLGGPTITEAHISTITDLIILLRYVEAFGEMKRAITLLKMRGSTHDKRIREYNIDGRGMTIGRPFENMSGILSGVFQPTVPEEIERLDDLFDE